LKIFSAMKKIVTVLLIFNFLFGISGIAQETIYYNKTLNLGNDWAAAYSISNIGTDNIIAATGGPAYTMSIIRTDYFGNMKIRKKYHKTGFEYYMGYWGSLSFNAETGLLDLGGNIGMSTQDTNCGFLMLLDTICDSVFTRKYSTNNKYMIVKMSRPTKDNGYIIIGQDRIFEYNADVVIIKTDAFGKEQWRQYYGSSDSAEFGYSVVQTPDKGYLLGCQRFIPGNDYSGDTWIIKTDSLGNKEWDLKPGSVFYDTQAIVGLSMDGNYIAGCAVGTRQDITYPVPDSYRRINFLKISPTGQIIWQKAFGPSLKKNYLCSMMELKDGSIVGVGFYNPYPILHDKSWLLKANRFGDSTWMREYWHSTGDFDINLLYDVDTAHDKGFVMTGQHANVEPPSSIQRIWLVKVDSCGCDTAGCDPTVNIREPESENVGIEIFPVPANETINILSALLKHHVCKIQIYDLFGRKQKEIMLPEGNDSAEIKVADLKAGLYVLQLSASNGTILNRKIVVE
jgi:Secretion system C-terminal sorting domain